MIEFWNDLRFGTRLLRRNPVFAATAAGLLGLGIGANTLIFGVVDTLLLRPLPVREPERLVRLVEVHPTGFVTWDQPKALYEELAKNPRSLSDILCQGDLDVAFRTGGSTERIRINAVSGNFFETLGLKPHLGRTLGEDDERSMTPAAVLSYDFWQHAMAADSRVIGRSVHLNGHAFTVVGVLAQGVNGLTVDTSPAMRVPLATARGVRQSTGPDSDNPLFDQVQVFGRLKPGVTMERAQAEIEAPLRAVYQETMLRSMPELAQRPGDIESRFRLESAAQGVSTLRGQFSKGLLLLMAGVGLLLLMACANVACLLLARSAARAREMSIRRALGASGWRMVRQLLTEALVLAGLGCVLGIVVTYAGKPLLLSVMPPLRDRAAVAQTLAMRIDIDRRILGFAVLVSLATGLLFGLSPAVAGARQALADAMRGGRSTTARLTGRNALVAAQVAVCLLLLAGASLLVETFQRMQTMNPGFDRDHIATFTIDPEIKGYPSDRAKALSVRLLEEARVLPGVVAAANAGRGLMRGTGMKATFGAAGQPLTKNDFLNSSLNSVTPGYFDAMGMHVTKGRDFGPSDVAELKPKPVIVNEAFARRFLGGGNPVGRLIGMRGSSGVATADDVVVGVVSNAKYRSLREEIPPTVYSAAPKGFDSGFVLHVRTHGDPAGAITGVRAALRRLDPELPFIEIKTLREEVEISLWQERLLAQLSALFGGFAALLAGIGLYGALDALVKTRTREIGIRVALGAAPARVVRLVSMETAAVVAAGGIAGLGGYAWSLRWIRLALYEAKPGDPNAVLWGMGFIGVVALLASAGPVWRAVRLDPMTALRED